MPTTDTSVNGLETMIVVQPQLGSLGSSVPSTRRSRQRPEAATIAVVPLWPGYFVRFGCLRIETAFSTLYDGVFDDSITQGKEAVL